MPHPRRLLVLFTVLGFAACADEPQPTASTLTQELPVFADGAESATTTGQHLIKLSTNAPSNLAAAVEAAGGTLIRTHPQIGYAVVEGLDDNAASQFGQATPDMSVAWQEGVSAMGNVDASGPGEASHDPTTAGFYPVQWDMHQIDAAGAWAAGGSGDGVRVAIIDSGIDPFHADLAGLIDQGASIAFTPSLSGFGPPWMDDRYHGTHVAGTVVTNGIGTSGVAPQATLIAIKSLDYLGSGSFADVIAGILHAVDVADADVINMSLGAVFLKRGGGGFMGAGPLIGAMNQALNYAQSRGAVVVSAAGNNGLNLQNLFDVTSVPCESGAGMCVSATGPTDALASYSNSGRSTVNVAGPGGDFNGDFAASSVLAPCTTGSLVLPFACGPLSYLFLDGTSMAAPHVAGVAALVIHDMGGASPGRVRTKIEQTADDLGRKGADDDFGKGRINACAAIGC
ncbi:MAG: S8 family serine peptidase [Gemmatimonadota bacterium]|nr:S8 family serine peptidase [Gemmatimonadota bacterium]